ncbi:Uu.00g124730.m01.CDS01 [Anthostomella pinea]|uniref:Uu.00g124730.m01.CDS01 n=1 Tax=Anthostomella pinea TaxID=933095 RepID=A0AAI8VIP1_9PEZI|nr:Uu.00g124730.m01.CDS01 [Anthostomella pinea]
MVPFLPADRPATLTPSPSREDLIPAPESYGAFGTLPFEIRRQILTEAFGNRTLHLSLSAQVRAHRPSPEAPTQTHCGLGAERATFPRASPRCWRWFSCVCHRRAEWTDEEVERTFSRRIHVGGDRCLQGLLCACEAWEGEGPGKCFVGALGWLRSCRQAYVEGVDVLYAANTFHISMVLQAFPNLRSLHILLYGWISPYSPRPADDFELRAAETFVLGPVEDMLRAMGPGIEFNIAIPKSGWRDLRDKYLRADSLLRLELDGPFNGRFWKALDGGGEFGY